MTHRLNRATVVNRWNRDYPPRLTIAPGDVVEVETQDASDGQVRPNMSAADFAKIDTYRIHALTGPIAVEKAEPGDRLTVEILDYQHEGWAWTSIIPGLGLLAGDFEKHFIHTWKLEACVTRSMPGLTIPLAPFCGIIGVQPAEPGEHRTRPPATLTYAILSPAAPCTFPSSPTVRASASGTRTPRKATAKFRSTAWKPP